MQIGDEKTGKLAMMHRDSQWMGNDMNRSEPANPPASKYLPGTFPMPEKNLRMTDTKTSKRIGKQATAESPDPSKCVKAPAVANPVEPHSAKETTEGPTRMMTPRYFSTVEKSSCSESPRKPSLIDSKEEARQETEARGK